VAVAEGNGVCVGRGSGVAVAGRAVGGSGVRVGRLRNPAAREVGVAVAPGTQALNIKTRQKRAIISEKSFLLIIAIPIIYFSLSYASLISSSK
jgi:hypothetical protein